MSYDGLMYFTLYNIDWHECRLCYSKFPLTRRIRGTFHCRLITGTELSSQFSYFWSNV